MVVLQYIPAVLQMRMRMQHRIIPPSLAWPYPIVLPTVERPETMQDAVIEIVARYHGAVLDDRYIDALNMEIQAAADYYPERLSDWWAVRSSRQWGVVFIARWHVAISLYMQLWCARVYGQWYD